MHYDVIILGGGSAGIVAGVTLGGFGLKVLLIEKEKLGGECLNTGCVPSKALIASAKAADTLRRGEEFGLKSVAVTREDAEGVMDRVRATVRDVGVADASDALLRRYGVEIRTGNARFLSPDSLEFEGETLAAEHFILCTGSHPVVPDLPGIELIHVLTNQTLFDLSRIPERLVVVGGGPVGVEMAQAFARLGCDVTLVQRGDRLLPKDDAELALELQAYLVKDGVTIHLASEVARFESVEGNSSAVTQSKGREETSVRCHHVLFATGRAPNVERLNLNAAGVEVTSKGVTVDGTLHTTGKRVWACGDILGEHQFSHMAEHEAKLLAQNLFLPVRQRAHYKVAPWCTFTDPELAHVGLTEEEAKRQGIPYHVLRQPFSQNDRALTEGEGKGQVKILVSPGLKGTILGAHILGPRAGELLQEFVLAMEQGKGIRALADSIHVYPTLTMANQHAAQRWYERLAEEPTVQNTLSTYRAVRPALPALTKAVLAGAAAGGLWWLSKRGKSSTDEHS